jgi:hypothetical protein
VWRGAQAGRVVDPDGRVRGVLRVAAILAHGRPR